MRTKPISADTLFHFTYSRKTLISILQNNFWPRYSLEDLAYASTDKQPILHGVPMVSFCDIPLSMIHGHARTYGEYAIGLTKNWAKSKGISPVIYVHTQSDTAVSFRRLIKSLPEVLTPTPPNGAASLIRDVLKLSFYLKPYEGTLRRLAHRAKRVRFYDEREWRFIPSIPNFHTAECPALIPLKQMRDGDFVRGAQDRLAQLVPLIFQPKNIRYIIVKKENEVLDMYHDVIAIKEPRFKLPDVQTLATRIISMERILNDF